MTQIEKTQSRRKKSARKGNFTMKQTLFLMLAVVLVVGLSGCCGTRGCGPSSCLIDGSSGTCADSPETCQPCDTGGCGSCAQNSGCEAGGQSAQACGCNECRGSKGGRLRGLLSSVCPSKCGPCGSGGPCAGGGCLAGGGQGGCGQAGNNLMSPIAYPYYTLRGPRDFLAKNPPSIGP